MKYINLLLSLLSLLMLPVLSQAQWETSPRNVLSVTDETGLNQQMPSSVSDSGGSVFIAWWQRQVSDTSEIMIQKFDQAGNIQWGSAGIRVFSLNASFSQEPKMVSDGFGGVVVLCIGRGPAGTQIIRTQRINPYGAGLWGAEGLAITSSDSNQSSPALRSTGADGYLFAWMQDSGIYNSIHAQLLDTGGMKQWGPEGKKICNAVNKPSAPQIAGDGSGGAYISWGDNRPGTPTSFIYAQHVDATGSNLWPPDGIRADSSVTAGQIDPLAEAGAGNSLIVVYSKATGSGSYYFAQRLSPAGTKLWGTGGKRISWNRIGQRAMVGDGKGGLFVAWDESSAGMFYDQNIYLQHIDSSGSLSFDTLGIPVCAAPGYQITPKIAYGDDKVAVSWQDGRLSGYQLYGQILSAVSGNEYLPVDGDTLCSYVGVNGHALVYSDGGFVSTWAQPGGSGYRLFATKLAADNTPLPVKDIEFSVHAEGRDPVLTWKSASAGTTAFRVERSLDGTGFQEIGRVAAEGKGTSVYRYKDTGIPAAAAKLLYRLKIDNKDGTFSFTEIRAINLHNPIPPAVYPNPAGKQLTFESSAGSSFSIIDMNGKTLLAGKCEQTITSINTSAWMDGIYILEVDMDNGGRATKMFILHH